MDGDLHLYNDSNTRYHYGFCWGGRTVVLENICFRRSQAMYWSDWENPCKLGCGFSESFQFTSGIKATLRSVEGYFPGVDFEAFDKSAKEWWRDIQKRLRWFASRNRSLPVEAKLGSEVAYFILSEVIRKIKGLPAEGLLLKSVSKFKFQRSRCSTRTYFGQKHRILALEISLH